MLILSTLAFHRHEHIEVYRKQLRSALNGRDQDLIHDITGWEKFNEGFEVAVITWIIYAIACYFVFRLWQLE